MRLAVTAVVFYTFLVVVRAKVGNAVNAGTGGLSEYHELVVVLDVRHQSEILGDINGRAEPLQLLCLVLCLYPWDKIVIPQLCAAVYLREMRFDSI